MAPRYDRKRKVVTEKVMWYTICCNYLTTAKSRGRVLVNLEDPKKWLVVFLLLIRGLGGLVGLEKREETIEALV